MLVRDQSSVQKPGGRVFCISRMIWRANQSELLVVSEVFCASERCGHTRRKTIKFAACRNPYNGDSIIQSFAAFVATHPGSPQRALTARLSADGRPYRRSRSSMSRSPAYLLGAYTLDIRRSCGSAAGSRPSKSESSVVEEVV